MTPVSFATMAGVPYPPPPPPPPQGKLVNNSLRSALPSTNHHHRPQYSQHHQISPPSVPNIDEAKGTHSRALQNLVKAQLVPRQPHNSVLLPRNAVAPFPNNIRVLSPPNNQKLGSLPPTPNVSPSSLSSQGSSLPPTPKSLKRSHSSSMSVSSPEFSNHSPPVEHSGSRKPIQHIIPSSIPAQHALSNVVIKVEQHDSTKYLNHSNRASAFTAVRSNICFPGAPSLLHNNQPNIKTDPSIAIQYNNELPSIPRSDKIIIPTARRLVPLSNTNTVIRGQIALQHVKNSQNMLVEAESSKMGSNMHLTDANKIITLPLSFSSDNISDYGSSSLGSGSRKRSLDSSYEREAVKNKEIKMETVKRGPSSLPSSSAAAKREHERIGDEAPQDDKDMWRPW